MSEYIYQYRLANLASQQWFTCSKAIADGLKKDPRYETRTLVVVEDSDE